MVKKQNFLVGAFILAVAGAVSKALGAVYRIPLARLIGGEGMGLYQMAYPIYTTILALATAGVPVAISVLVARKETEGLRGDSRRIFRVSLVGLALLGLVLSIVVWQGAGFLARNILHEPRAVYPIMAIAPAIFFSGLMSVFRGYFQGYQWMVPTAVSQVVEQIFRVTFVLILAYLLFPRGLEYAAAGATFGAVVGGIAGLIFLLYSYIRFRRQMKRDSGVLPCSRESSVELGWQVVKLAVPISFGAVVVPLVQMLDAVIVPGRLMASGYSTSQATALYGQLSGMASVLINLPTIFTIAIATSLVPAVSEVAARKDWSELRARVNNGVRAAMLISLPSAAGLYVLARQITDLLFASPEAGIPLEPLAFSVIVLAAFQVSSASLQGLARPDIPLRNLIITGLLKVFFNYYLTGTFLAIRGPAIGTVVAFFVGSCLNFYELRKISRVSFEGKRFIKLVVTTTLMGVGVKMAYQGFVAQGLYSYYSTVLAIGAGVLLYGGILFVIRELDIKTIRSLIKV